MGVVLESRGTILEDACWLRPTDDSQHINLAELDAMLKGVNLALQWQAKVVHLYTDSLCVYHWLTNTLTGKTRVRTKAASEMLVRRRLSTLQKLIEEYGLVADVKLTTSERNLADKLTRVPKRWLNMLKEGAEPPTCATLMGQLTNEQIRAIHKKSGHPGVRRTTYFVRRVCPAIAKSMVRTAIRDCEECCALDPAPIRWKKGKLEVDKNWWRLGMDVTHYEGSHFLSLTDCGPTRFTVWRPLARQDALSVVRQLKSIFCERGAPVEILTDNAPTFCSRDFRDFATEWGVRVRYRGAYVPEGNGIAERCQRSVKK